MYHSVFWAPITKYLGSLNNRNLFSDSSGGWKSKYRCQHGQILVRLLFLAYRWPLLLLCPHEAEGWKGKEGGKEEEVGERER